MHFDTAPDSSECRPNSAGCLDHVHYCQGFHDTTTQFTRKLDLHLPFDILKCKHHLYGEEFRTHKQTYFYYFTALFVLACQIVHITHARTVSSRKVKTRRA